jgi:TolB-like protein/AraC-like DNA-binding protein
MFTDIVGYSAMMQQDEEAAAKVRKQHREEFQKYHGQYHGEILQYYGDGTLSVFQSGVQAIECAIAIQRKLNQGDKVPLRIGVHMGDVVFDGTEIYGDGVNVASRIEGIGIAGAILLSGKLNDELQNHKDISTIGLGNFEFKNIGQPTPIYAVTNDGIKIPDISALKGKHKTDAKSIAVLPFVNMSSNEETEYFSDGMTEEIINALAKIKSLKVTSRTSSFFFKNKQVPIPQIGKELNVSTILEGSIRLSGNMMRITAQLINVGDDFHFWSETWDRKLESIFEIQDEISLEIAEKLREDVGHFDIADHLIDAPEIPVEVYKKYLKGRFLILKYNVPEVEDGISVLQGIIEKYPEFPLAYLVVNQGYSFLGAVGMMSSEESFSKGKYYLDKAIGLDEDLPECQYGHAGISYWFKWDLEGASKQINRALELRPGYADAYQLMAAIYMTLGKYQVALHAVNKAIQLDPFSMMNHYIKGIIYYFQEYVEEAIPHFEKSVSLDENFTLSKLALAHSLQLLGQTEKAIKIYEGLPADRFGTLSKLGGLTLAHLFLDEQTKAAQGIAELEEVLQEDSKGWVIQFLMLCYIKMGNHTKAIQLIEQAVANRFPFMITIGADPVFKPLVSYPRFHDLVKDVIGDKYYRDVSFKWSSAPNPNKAKHPQMSNEFFTPEKKPLLDKEKNDHYSQKLLALIANDSPYLEPQLTLKRLADLIGINSNQLSWLLNNHFGKSFNDFINHYRIATFKQIARDPKNAHITLIGLAYESGFNSKTVFNTYFKKEIGVTPKAWMKSATK